MSMINSDEHDAEHGVRSGPEQPLALESIATSQGRHPTNRATSEKQGRVCERSGTEESEANRSAAETNSLDRSSCHQNHLIAMYCARLHTADRFARFAQLRRARTCSATGSPYSWLKPCFSDIHK